MATFIERYEIVFKGLKTGVHQYSFDLDNRFFGHFESPELRGGDMRVDVDLDKKNHFISLVFTFMGEVRIVCDRCLEEFNTPLNFSSSLVIKFVDEERENDADIIYLKTNEHKINLSDYLLESIRLTLPIKRAHKKNNKGEYMCNKDMINKLEEHQTKRDNEKTDPRWDPLKNIIKKN